MTDPATDAAFTAFLQQHRAHALAFLQRLCPREAEDLLQETLAKVWRYRGSWDPARNAAAWLLQAAFRTFLDQQRRRAREVVADEQLVAEQTEAPACAAELRDELTRALAALSELERALLLGFHGQQRSLQELARQHRLPLNTVKSHLHRARRKLAAENPDAR